ncbi:MAG: extracellular solute-binding protein [Chloroflexi bacterium]|nr:extracellular solute-binding protein [Chloroflexota bacterium]
MLSGRVESNPNMPQKRWRAAALSTMLIAAVLLAACGSDTGDNAVAPTGEPTNSVAVSPSVAAGENSGTATIAPADTTDNTLTDDSTLPSTRSTNPSSADAQQPPPPAASTEVVVWWPVDLYPDAGSTAEVLLLDQFDGFRETSSYGLEVRQKRASGLGVILPTLRTAEPVAPGAMPDLTLMRRSDMMTAATEELIIPLDEWVPGDMLDDLIPGVRELGEIDGQLYGIPYALTIYHTVYRASAFEEPLLTFDDVLEQEPAYLFPATPSSGAQVNWTVLLQYLAAGGELVDDSGAPYLDEDALRIVLEFYAEAVELGVFGPDLLEYSDSDEYWSEFVANDANLIGISSMAFLSHRNTVQNVELAAVPTTDGTSITLLDGWMWVVTTNDSEGQKRARAFVSWMMRINQQGVYTEALGMLPSQQQALRSWDNVPYTTFTQIMIASARLVPSAERNNKAAVALQGAVEAVLQGTPVDQAIADAFNHMESS